MIYIYPSGKHEIFPKFPPNVYNVAMPLLSFQFIFQKLKKFLVLKNQKKFSGHPRINNLKFFDLEKLTRNSVKNDVGFHPKESRKQFIQTSYVNVTRDLRLKIIGNHVTDSLKQR